MTRRPSSTRPLRMRGRSALAAVFAAFALALGSRPAAAADQFGGTGRIVKLEIRASASDDRITAHGRISVRRGNGKTEHYEWGGSACPAAKFTEAEIGILERAFHNRGRTIVTPRYKTGEATGVRCLVGFELSAG